MLFSERLEQLEGDVSDLHDLVGTLRDMVRDHIHHVDAPTHTTTAVFLQSELGDDLDDECPGGDCGCSQMMRRTFQQAELAAIGNRAIEAWQETDGSPRVSHIAAGQAAVHEAIQRGVVVSTTEKAPADDDDVVPTTLRRGWWGTEREVPELDTYPTNFEAWSDVGELIAYMVEVRGQTWRWSQIANAAVVRAAELGLTPTTQEEQPAAAPLTLESLAAEIRAWQIETFPNGTPLGAAEHLLEEARELVQELRGMGKPRAYDFDRVREEAADVLLLLIAVAGMVGFDLLPAAVDKMEINRNRTWESEPNERGYRKHVSESVDRVVDDVLLANRMLAVRPGRTRKLHELDPEESRQVLAEVRAVREALGQ